MISGQVPVRQIHVHDTWAVRDLPVLDATIGLLEHSYMVTVTDIAAKTALDPSVVAQALEALDPVYVDFRKTTTGGDPRFWYVFKVTPEARRAVGQWPTAEALAGRLAEELATAARREDDAEHQGLLAYAARLIGDTLRDATVRAAGAVLAPAFGGIPVPEVGQQVPPPAPRPDVEFESLVPLPELPELLRPDGSDRSGGPGRAAAVTSQPEPAPLRPESGVTSQSEHAPPPAPKLSLAEPSVAERSVAEPSVAEPGVAEPGVAEPSVAEPSVAERRMAGEADTVAPTQAPAAVPDLNPWPGRPGVAPAPAAPSKVAPEPEPTPFRPSLAPWPAVDADPDAADTDMDLVQARQDTV
jgi:hypothetical protein